MKPLIACLLCCWPLIAQNQTVPSHKFIDRTAAATLTTSAGLYAADAAITCQNIGRNGWREAWLPFQSCADVGAWMGSSMAAQTGAAYFFHRTGHHRLERLAEYFWASGSAIGISYSLAHLPKPVSVPLLTTVPAAVPAATPLPFPLCRISDAGHHC